ncbi:Na(+)/H(+) antiporter subunit C [Mycolicibacterium poriferae]|uniref:Na(+)/H(+) antiporter subunit C n=1 Tax=Mycolicibacterium poriferae TaxID=39694 RepID=UPI0024BADAF3|nr:Na(+)/H(+) antiporter subunit C [Mycolicibacterium poriferae]|tara:strand:- start:195 stop:653 length:459 start_codon:yes stop_codon:yes gene_type:complete
MSPSLVGLIAIGAMLSCGVYLVLDRSLTRMLLGVLLISNAVNLLLLITAGPSGNPPVRGRTVLGREITADPLAQAMILTAIVITMGVAAFMLALAYRSYQLTTAEEIGRDPEDVAVAERSEDDHRDVVTERPARSPGERADLDELYDEEHET